MATTQCRGVRRDGTPCGAQAGPGGWCWAHDPDNGEARRAARSRGGKGKATAARAERLLPASLRPLFGTLLAAVEAVEAGTLPPQRAAAMASLAGAAVKVFQVGVLEQRVADLEEHAAEGRRAG